jgi:hypothetical protein
MWPVSSVWRESRAEPSTRPEPETPNGELGHRTRCLSSPEGVPGSASSPACARISDSRGLTWPPRSGTPTAPANHTTPARRYGCGVATAPHQVPRPSPEHQPLRVTPYQLTDRRPAEPRNARGDQQVRERDHGRVAEDEHVRDDRTSHDAGQPEGRQAAEPRDQETDRAGEFEGAADVAEPTAPRRCRRTCPPSLGRPTASSGPSARTRPPAPPAPPTAPPIPAGPCAS